MKFSLLMYDLIAALSLLNFGRIFMMLIGSDIYDLKLVIRNHNLKKKASYRPKISVIIPAYNEELGVIRTLDSVLANSYSNKQVIVVNDGSKDKTLTKLRNFQRKHPGQVVVVNQENAGKAAAINRAVKFWATGTLVMVLDADSLLHPDAISNMVKHFRDRRVIAAASNVKVIPTNKILGLAQRIEYLISYRMKRALTVLKMEYIIGGVGSTFRKSLLLKAGLYDTDTMTEDIDLTLKLIKIHGNRHNKIHYAADSIAYTEHVLNFKSLVRQRYRWKYGRFQSLIKNRSLFFNEDDKYTRRLTLYQLPYALFGEVVLLVEPLLVAYILFVAFRFADISSLLSVYAIVTTYIFFMLLGEDSESLKSKISLSFVIPFMYIVLYVLTIVELFALLKSVAHSKQLFSKSSIKEVSWEHVERSGKPISLS